MISASHNPMPDNGIKFLARGGRQARRPDRDRDREPSPRAVGPPDRRCRRPRRDLRRRGGRLRRAPRRHRAPPARRHPRRPRLRPRCRLRGRAPRARRRRRRGRRDQRQPRRAQHQRRLRLDPPRAGRSGRSSSTVPTSASPSTATPTAAWPWTTRATWSTATSCSPCWRSPLRDAGTLAKDTVVVTVMSNLGFVHAMRANEIGVRQTKVGDRYVLEAMNAVGYSLGGEQSGHVIMSSHATTGDGILTALHVLARMAERKASARRARRGDDPAAAGAGQRQGRRQGPRRRGRAPRAPRSPRPRPSWATPGGCCCGRPGPSRWCA